MPHWLRARLPYVALAISTIVVGLAVLWRGNGLPAVARDVIGDALWAAMIAWWAAAAAPAARIAIRGAAALAFCFAIEFSQLYHTPWLDALRRTLLGQLTLGSGFDPRDLAAYSAGVLAAAFLEYVATRRQQ